MLLRQVPAARPDDQRRHRRIQPVHAAIGAQELDAARDRIAQVDLSADHVVPGRGQRILAVRHEHACARVERIDDHLAIGRAGDLDATVGEVRGRNGDPPVAVAHCAGLGQEIGQLTGVDLGLARHPPCEQLRHPRAKSAREIGHEAQRTVGQNLRVFRTHVPRDGAARRQIERGRCTQVRTLVEMCRGRESFVAAQ